MHKRNLSRASNYGHSSLLTDSGNANSPVHLNCICNLKNNMCGALGDLCGQAQSCKTFESLNGHVPAKLGAGDALSHFNSLLQPTECHVVHILGLFGGDSAV